jgi:uroporphyrin-III C-methyltransferase
MIDNKPYTKRGKVILAGAGPGDPELITLKLSKALQKADVIITDRLVNPAIIENFSNGNAEIILTGKQGYSDASVTMKEINLLITRHALQGKTVLRLKGGDIAFFSNVLDELQNLVKHHIPFEIIPGITAASGASAFTGIPLTARGYAKGVQFHTYYIEDQFMPAKWKQLATSTDTLVFYMSASHSIGIANKMLNYGANPETPIAMIEQATTSHQQVHTTVLSECEKDFTDRSFSSPSLLIIGKVVQLHEAFHWVNVYEEGTVFKQFIHVK